jgi:hypothetical protein
VIDDAGRNDLAVARLATLYVLSLLPAATAVVAWGGAGPLRLALLAGGLALAVLLGTFLAGALSAVGSASLRRRARMLALVLVPVPSVLAVAVVFSVPRLAAGVASNLVLLQIVLVLMGEAFGLEILVLWGSLVLAVVAVPGGRIHGGIALTGFLALLGVYLALDHVLRRLALWPHAAAPPVGLVVRDGLRAVLVPVVLLAIALATLPAPSPAETRAALALNAPEVGSAYRWLLLVVLAGTGSLVIALRGLRPGGGEASPLVEMAETHVEAEELLERPPDDGGRYAPARERIIRTYVRVLARAREAGLRLDPSLTPREIEARLRRPAAALDILTGLFMDARYGPDEPDGAAVTRAETAAREIVASRLHRRRLRRPVAH